MGRCSTLAHTFTHHLAQPNVMRAMHCFSPIIILFLICSCSSFSIIPSSVLWPLRLLPIVTESMLVNPNESVDYMVAVNMVSTEIKSTMKKITMIASNMTLLKGCHHCSRLSQVQPMKILSEKDFQFKVILRKYAESRV